MMDVNSRLYSYNHLERNHMYILKKFQYFLYLCSHEFGMIFFFIPKLKFGNWWVLFIPQFYYAWYPLPMLGLKFIHVYKMGPHDDVIKWKHFPRYWPFVRGIHRSPVNSPHKGQWRGALMFTLICARINGWVNNREAGDLRRNPAHYDVIVMSCINLGKRMVY